MQTVGVAQKRRQKTSRDRKVCAAERRFLDVRLTREIEDPDVAGSDLHLLAFCLREQPAGLVNLNQIMVDACSRDRLFRAPELDRIALADAKHKRAQMISEKPNLKSSMLSGVASRSKIVATVSDHSWKALSPELLPHGRIRQGSSPTD